MKRTRVISVTSGKGGVGKTTLVANLANQLGFLGKKVLVLDGDFGMANADIAFNVRVDQTIYDVIAGRSEIEDIIIDVDDSVSLIPGGSGIYELQSLKPQDRQRILDQVAKLSGQYDYMLVDTAPGISDHVLYLNAAAGETIVVVTPDPASITDSYALIKVLNQRYRENQFAIVCNDVKDEKEGVALFTRLNDVVNRFLSVRLNHLGSIPNDLNLRHCTRTRRLINEFSPESPAARGIEKLADRFNGAPVRVEAKGGLQFFWQQLVGAV